MATRFDSPFFSVSCVRGRIVPDEESPCGCDSLVAVASGGGSARSGIANCVKLLSVDVVGGDGSKGGKPAIVKEPVASFDTKDKLVTQLDVSVDRRFVACTQGAGCRLLEIAKRKEEKKEEEENSEGGVKIMLEHVLEQVTDEDESEPAQNVVRFSRLQPHRLATGGADGIVRVWDIEESDESAVTLARAGCLKRHTKEVKDLAFHPLNEDLLVSVSPDSTCRVWNLASMELIQMLPSDTARGMTYRSCRFSSDGHSLLTLQNPRRRGASYLVVWRQHDVKASATKETIDAKGTFMVQSATKVADVPSTGFDASADGRAIAISDCAGGITVLDQSSYSFVGKFPGVHALPVTGITFLGSMSNKDTILSSHIATCSMDKSCAVVCVPTQRSSSTLGVIFYTLLFLLLSITALLATAYVACEDKDSASVENDDFLNVPVCGTIQNAVSTLQAIFSENVKKANSSPSFLEHALGKF